MRPGWRQAGLAFAWAVAIGGAASEVTRRRGWSWAPLLLVHGVTPQQAPATAATGLLALRRRRWLLAAIALGAAAAQLTAVAPAMRRPRSPAARPPGPTLRLLVANVLFHNERADEAAAALAGADADVLLLVELSPHLLAAIERRGLLATHPHAMLEPAPNARGAGILSRLPLTACDVLPLADLPMPAATVCLRGRAVRLLDVHTVGPFDERRTRQWRRGMDELAELARQIRGPLVMAGDFNATRWHRRFHRLLSAGLVDGHEANGRGLSMSWPVDGRLLGRFGPIMRLDPVLVRDLDAVAIEDVVIPGSDHLGILVEVAVLGNTDEADLLHMQQASRHAYDSTRSPR